MQQVSTFSTPSENILKLRALMSKLDKNIDISSNGAVLELKELCKSSEADNKKIMNTDLRLSYYEKLFSKILHVLNQIKTNPEW